MDTIEEKIIESKLKYNQLFYAVLHSSEILVTDGSIDEVMQEVIEGLGESALVDRCYVYKNNYDGPNLVSMKYAYEWVRHGIEAHIKDEELREIKWSRLGFLKNILESKNSYFGIVNSIKEKEFRMLLMNVGVKSVLFTPIYYDKKFWGFIGFDDCLNEREWLDMEISTLVAISANIGAFLKRSELALEIEKQYHTITQQKEFYESIFRNIPADIVAVDRDQRYLFLNKSSVKDDQVRDWLIGKDDYEYCIQHGKDIALAKKRRTLFNDMLIKKEPYSFEEKFQLEDGKYKKHLRIMHPVLDENGEVFIAIGYGVDITKTSEQEDIIMKQNEAISNSPDGIALLDANGNYTYMNDAHSAIFEYDTEELIGKSWHTIYMPAEIDRISKDVFPVLGEKEIWSGESVGISKFGRPVYQDITLRLMPDGSLICITRDVSNLVQNIHLLEQTNQKLELAINTSNLGMWEWNLETDELVCNDIFKNLLGLTNENKFSNVKQSWFDSIHSYDREIVEKALQLSIKNEGISEPTVYNAEYRIRNQSGDFIWVLDFGKVVDFSESGKPKYMIGFILDISKNKRIEEEIRTNEKRYRDLVENLREVIFEANYSGELTFLNPAWSEITGYTQEESLGKNLLDYCTPEMVPSIKNTVANFLKSDAEKWLNLEFSLIHKLGDTIWLDVEINKQTSLDQLHLSLVGSIENITARKLAEEELKKALDSERLLGELKSRFVSMASHEFRTPLAGIRSSAELIKLYASKKPEMQKMVDEMGINQKVDNIVFDVDRITSLMTDVLTMGKIEVEKVDSKPELKDMCLFLDDYLQNEAIRYVNEHKLIFENPQVPLFIWFDPKLVVHVFNNIISNASKYSEVGSTIFVSMKIADSFVQLLFKDCGIGIPKDEQMFSFDSFYRSSNVENIPGTGLGLPIAKYFMELHQGKIFLESDLGKGTTVILEFPLAEAI
ncbi:MAG: hypothetical protein CFE21_09830 [Bacteroidetes bacterium B1(2017)]|nr:MAG: hypothetical protein CFE21_09830 [Bacteroidetes bacterium B1(2017)]